MLTRAAPTFPKGPCTRIVYTLALKYLYKGTSLRQVYIYCLNTLALKYLYRDYFKAKVYILFRYMGPLGFAVAQRL